MHSSLTTASADAGPGCSSASAKIAGIIKLGSVAFNSSTVTYVNEPDICLGPGGSASPTSPAILASNAATAYAESVSTTCLDYSAHVCACGNGNPSAVATVAGSLEATASAYAEAFTTAVASLSCSGDLLAGASVVLASLAASTQTAINSVYVALASSPGSCTATGLQKQVKLAVARAVACTFYQIYVAYDEAHGATASACGLVAALSGPEWSVPECSISYCP
jgi:hypothetical protein